MSITHDLENSPLQIKTDSEDGSKETVIVRFRTDQGDLAGAVLIWFSSPPKILLGKCDNIENFKNFSSTLPSETDKVWTITLSRFSEKKRVFVHCNNEQVLNVLISGTACERSGWETTWSNDVEKIYFDSKDNASDYYRSGK